MFNRDVTQKIKDLKSFYEPNLITGLFSWSELESLLNLRPFVNDKRFTIVNDNNYEWDYCSWLTDVNSFPPNIIQEVIKQNVCYLKDCSRVNKQVNSVCKELERVTDLPTDAHIYFSITETDVKGFGTHWDYSHNLIVQVEGETHFRVWGETPDKTNRVIESKDDPQLNVIMRHGDAIFVPAYVLHCATSVTQRLSISFPMTMDEKFHQSRDWIVLPLRKN